MLLQVDQHVETLCIVCRGQEDVVMAGTLARKQLKPKQVTVFGSYTDQSLSAMAALLTTEQHHPMFQQVQQLTFRRSFPQCLPQVSEKPHLD
jgi:citrate lyase synthetase